MHAIRTRSIVDSALRASTRACRTRRTPRSRRRRQDHPTLATADRRRGVRAATARRIRLVPAMRRTPSSTDRAYAALLGCYLGDGYISRSARRLRPSRLMRRGATPAIIDDVERADRRRQARRPGPHEPQRPGASSCQAHWKHWPCLFPQHGPGRKHERPIVLEDWQRAIVEAHPATVPPRALPLRRLPGEQLGDPDGRRRAEALRLPALAVHERLRRHPRAVLLGARPRRRPVAAVQPRRRSASRPAPASHGSTS